MRKIQLFTFFGIGAVWSDVEGGYSVAEDARHEFAAWGPSYFTPYLNGSVVTVDPNDPQTWNLREGEIDDARTFYKGRNLTIPFGAGIKRNFGKWLDLGIEYNVHWTRNDNLDGFSFPVWRNRVTDYYSTLGTIASEEKKHRDNNGEGAPQSVS